MGRGKGKGEGVDGSTANIVEEDERGNWDNQCDFFLSCLGYAVGLGNVWRFPYLCYKHGGGSFLVAYSLMLLLAGLPLFFLELGIGQYGGVGPSKLFGRIAPAFKGLGYGMLFVTTLVAIYYNMIIAWTLYFTFAGFTSQLPWEFCGNAHNTMTCYNRDMAKECNVGNTGLTSYWNNTCTDVADICSYYNLTHQPAFVDKFNFTICADDVGGNVTLDKAYKRVSPSEDYYTRVVLGLEDDTTWENFGGLRWQLVLCLAGAWIIVGLCLVKGVQSSGKVVYFTALFPYFVLFVLLIKGATLPGAIDGISFYLQPRLERLADVSVWSDAATQIFYSLGPAFGGLITLASYNRFDNNCHRDAMLIAFANCSTSVFAGFVIFSIIGFMAHQSGQEVGDVIASGPGLAFIAYPEAVTQLPIAPFWSFLFFMMLITLGLDTQFTMTETLTSAFMDQWPQFRPKKSIVVLTAAFLGFLLGLPMCAKGGVYMFTLIDWFSASWSILLLAFTEVVLLMYVYGYDNFMNNIAEMGIKIPKVLAIYWRVNWQILTPIILMLITLVTWINFTPCKYGDYVFPGWVQLMGWLMASFSIVIAVSGGIFEYFRRKENGKISEFKDMLKPTDKWGPAVKITKPIQGHDLKEAAYNNDAFNYGSNK